MSTNPHKVLVHDADHPPSPALQAQIGANRILAVRIGPEPLLAQLRDGTYLAVVTPEELRAPIGNPHRGREAMLHAGVRVALRCCAGGELYLWLGADHLILTIP